MICGLVLDPLFAKLLAESLCIAIDVMETRNS